MRFYFRYIKPYLPFFIIGPILMLTEVVGEVLMPRLMANIINYGVTAESTTYILQTGGLMVLVALMMMGGGVGGNYFAAKASVSFSSDLRADLYKKVQSFSFANLDHFHTGSLVTRLTNDVTQLQNITRMSLVMMLRAPGMMIGAIIMATQINASLAVIIGVIAPILIVIIGIIMKTAFPRFMLMQKKIDALNTGIQENLTNVRVIKSFVREDFEEKRFCDKTEDLREKSLQALKMMVMTMPIMTLAMNITTLAVVWFGGQQVLVGDMLIGDLISFTTCG